MKLKNLIPILLLPEAIIPIVTTSCNKTEDKETEEEYIISHSGNFEQTIDNCEINKKYTVTFNFATDKEIDFNKYNLVLNTSEWKHPNAIFTTDWVKNNLTLTLKITITLLADFETQTTITADNLKIDLVNKTSLKTIKTYTFNSLKIILNETILEGEFIVSFETNGGSVVAAQKVKAGETATNPTTTKSNYDFVYWYDGDNIFDFRTKIKKNTTLYAHWTETDPYEYIHNRTFSLGCWGINKKQPQYYNLGWGTCWVLSDATPSTFDDYSYYIATNWHVIDGQDTIEEATSNFTVGFADDKSTSGITPKTGYTEFTSYQFEGYDKFYFNKSRNQCIDFVIAKADFNSASDTVKTKLNKLNYQQETEGYINRFVDTTYNTHYEGYESYIGGFPVNSENKAKWETHKIDANALKFYSSASHYVDTAEVNYDCSYQYKMKDYVETTWMDGGASGSMLISKLNNEWSPIGIYWGGEQDDPETPTKYWPYFSVFKSDLKDFTEGY